MAAEGVLELLDSYWFEHSIFSGNPSSFPRWPEDIKKDHEEDDDKENITPVPRLPTLNIVRSLSDLNLNTQKSFLSSDSEDLSPNSVLILSGKEDDIQEETMKVKEEIAQPKVGEMNSRRGRRRKGSGVSSSRSLSDLEFEELKGFMDLGFVFSEEDKDSSLVSIIPGLQRLGMKNRDKEEKSNISRPYLSEAWDVWEMRKSETPLMDWSIPALHNEVDMKDNLRFWAHTVASTFR